MALLTYKQKVLIKKYSCKIIAIAVIILVAALIIFPFIWMIPSALKDRTEIWSIPPKWFPNHFAWENFKILTKPDINGGYFYRSFLVTLFVAVFATILNLSINMLAAYGFARHEFRFKKVLWVIFLLTMFVPGITVQITSIQVVTKLGLTNSLWVLILPTAANAYTIFFFRQYFLGIPDAIEEAAEIDGATRIQIYTKIFLPMSKTPIIISAFGCFIGHWNSYVWPTLTITENQDKYRQIMQYIYMLNTTDVREYGQVIAATLIAMALPIIIFAIFQKQIVEGVTLSGQK